MYVLITHQRITESDTIDSRKQDKARVFMNTTPYTITSYCIYMKHILQLLQLIDFLLLDQ